MSQLPPISDPRWASLFEKDKKHDFQFLAINIVFTRLSIEAKKDPSPPNLKKVSQELWDVFQKNIHNPKVQNDVKKIFG